MALSKDRIIALGTTPYPHEQSAINFVLAALPDQDPFRLWGLIDLVDPGGRRYDIDLLIIGYHQLYLIEIKSHPGRIKGDVVDWDVTFPDGGRTTLAHPGRLVEHKSRVLASLLGRQMARGNHAVPWVQHLVFASAENVSLDLPGAAGNHVVTRANLVRALQFGEYPGATPQATRHRINRPQAVEIVNACKSIGLRPSHASRKVNDLVLGKLLVEHENYQDHLARHESISSMQARVRTYQVAQGVTLERRKQLVSAAEREARNLTLLSDHPNILKLRNYLSHGPTDGPCIVFEHLDGELPLDAFLRANPDLSLDDRVAIITRVGEALAYCHRKSILHRGLAPSSVLVRRNPEDPRRLDVRLFNFQLATHTESATGTLHHTSHLTVWRRSNEDVYVAPEVLENPKNATPASDLFSLGAIAYLVLVGRPPGQTLVEREVLLRRGYLSPATAREELAAALEATDAGQTAAGLPAALKDLEQVMEFATEKNPVNRGDDVTFWIGEFENALTRPSAPVVQTFVDPLVAKRDDEIAAGMIVEAVLGTGSTARTLRVRVGEATSALKVALSPELDERLRREGEILKGLQRDGRFSDRIVRLHEVMEIGGRTSLRLTDAGQTLARVLADEGAQSLDYGKRWGEDLLLALEFLEELGVQHRDIKPGNLGVLSAEQKRKRHLLLFDFSLSAAEATEVRLGTPAYRDPFLSQRGHWDDAADRWSAAITLHELLTGERPRWGAGDVASATEDEITLSAERFDATVRDRLVTFFRQALARDLGKRFPTAERMRTEWVACFASAPAPSLSADDHTEETQKAWLTDPLPEGLGLSTLVESLPLPARAKNGLYRAGVLRVADLLRLPNNELSVMRGVGRGTARAILDFVQRPEFAPLKDALAALPVGASPSGSPSAAPATAETVAVRSLEGWMQAALPPVTKKHGEKPLAHVRYLWGLDLLKGRTVDSVAELAAALGVTRPAIYQAVERMRQTWRELPFLDELRGLVLGALEATGGHAPLALLGDALAQALDRTAAPPPGDRRGQALVRIVVETHDDLRLAKIAGASWVVPAETDVRAIEQLGKVADALAQADPLLSPGGALAQLRAEAGALAALADEPLVALAVAASKQAAKSARLEIYPRGLGAARALDLCLAALPPAGVDAETAARIVAAAYPEAEAVPRGPELGDLLVTRGYTFDAKTGKFNRRALSEVTATQGPPTRALTTHTGHREKVDPDAHEFARDIQVREKRGSFCFLEVQPHLAEAAAQELARRLSVQPLSIDGLLLDAMAAVAADNEVELPTVFSADREGPAGPEWPNLKALMDQSAERVMAQLRGRTSPLVLTQPGLLARYGLGRFLKQLVDHARKDDTPAVFLMVPCGEEAGGGARIAHPAGDLPIPLTSPAQHLRVPRGFVSNEDRGRRLTPVPPVGGDA